MNEDYDGFITNELPWLPNGDGCEEISIEAIMKIGAGSGD